MSEMIAWIAASAERPEIPPGSGIPWRRRERRAEQARAQAPEDELSARSLPAHQFPAPPSFPGENAESRAPGEESPELELDRERDRQRRVYRGRTVAMLRRYMRYSLETGRLPSLLGREFFRSTVTRYRVTTFEDRVIFVHDMEICLERLDEISRQVLGRVVLQEYDHFEAARLLGCTRMTVHRNLLLALDMLSSILVEVGLLDALPETTQKSCQEGEEGDSFVSDCEDGK
jgi:hypothetical protein